MSDLGKRLKEERKKRKLTTQGLAEITNISRSNITKIENNQISPSANSIILISKALEISTDYLLVGKQSKEDLTEDEEKLIEKYRSLPEKKKGVLEYQLENLIKEEEENKIKSTKIS